MLSIIGIRISVMLLETSDKNKARLYVLFIVLERKKGGTYLWARRHIKLNIKILAIHIFIFYYLGTFLECSSHSSFSIITSFVTFFMILSLFLSATSIPPPIVSMMILLYSSDFFDSGSIHSGYLS